jgi:hypothetical protein
MFPERGRKRINAYIAEITKLVEYVESTEDKLIQAVRTLIDVVISDMNVIQKETKNRLEHKI